MYDVQKIIHCIIGYVLNSGLYVKLYHQCLCRIKYYQKVPGLGQKRNYGFIYSILAAISFKIVVLGMYMAISSFYFHASEAQCK
jgi:uncharacterized membrane protein